jgi:signal transduction histidine kinase
MSSEVAGRSRLSGMVGLSQALQKPALVAIAYYLAAQSAFYIGTLSDRIFAPFWPPNVVLFCALLVAPYSRWWLYLGTAFLAHVAAELSVGMPAPQIVVAFATNCVVAIMNAVLLRRFLVGPPWLSDLHKAGYYIAITAGLSPAIASLGGAFVPIMSVGTIDKFWDHWAHWYVANALASLTLGPIFLTWFAAKEKENVVAPVRWFEATIVGVALITVCLVGFNFATKAVPSAFLPAVLYSPLPLILWAAVRFGARGASVAILVVALALVSLALRGQSPFLGDDPESNVLALQLFLTGLSIPVLLLGAVTDQLRRAEATTRELARSVLKARDEERRRIARELHDSTGQNLIVATMLVGKLQRRLGEPEDPTVGQLTDVLQQSIRDLRTMSYVLHPPFLDEAGLPLALRSYVDGFSQRTGIQIALDVREDLERLPSDTELVLFRVVQEALSNISRHSGSSSAHIRLRRENNAGVENVVLTVEDAGKGMPHLASIGSLMGQKIKLNPMRGVGLMGMRERLHEIGGRLEIVSAAGGTMISAVVPINFAPEAA